YHHERDGVLAFSSTVASLLTLPWISREISPDALAECLTLRYVVSPRTLIEGVEKIPPGHLLIDDPGGREIRPWWSAHFRSDARPPGHGSKAEIAEEFGHRLEAATRRCLVADRPSALLLSDGIDSRALASVLSNIAPSVSAFTYRVFKPSHGNHFMTWDAGEGGILKREAITVTYDEMAQSVAPALADLNEPVGDGSAVATWLLIRKARPQAT